MTVPVTVVVVAYRHALFVRQCLDSVFSQTELPERVLVYDDRSPDDTAKVIEGYRGLTGNDFEFVVNDRNQGLCRTLNAALDAVRTPYFAYISADDWMEPERLARQVQVLEEAGPDCAFVYSDAYRANAEGKRLPGVFSEAYSWQPERLTEPYLQMLRDNWIPAPSVLLRVEAVREVGGYDPDLYFEDWDLWLRLTRRYAVAELAEPLVTFRELETSLGHTTFREGNLRFLSALSDGLRKHLGESPQADALVGQALWHLSRRRWFGGEAGRKIVEDFRRVAPIVPGPLPGTYARLAAWRVPGKLIGRVIKARRRVSDSASRFRSELGAVKQEVTRRRDAEIEWTRRRVRHAMVGARPRPALRRRRGVWAVSVVRNEIDVVEDMIRHCLDQGAARVLVADNMSDDGTYELLTRLSAELPVTVLRDTEPAFYQGAKISFLAQLAWRAGADWVLPVDADEFWFASGGTIAEYLATVAAPVVYCSTFNAYPIADDPDHQRLDITVHQNLRVAFRAHPFARVSEGNHWVRRPGKSLEKPVLRMVHLPWRSVEQMRLKVINGAKALQAANLGAGVDGHWQKMADAAEYQSAEMWSCVSSLTPTELEFGYKPVGPFEIVDFRTWTTWPATLP